MSISIEDPLRCQTRRRPAAPPGIRRSAPQRRRNRDDTSGNSDILSVCQVSAEGLGRLWVLSVYYQVFGSSWMPLTLVFLLL